MKDYELSLWTHKDLFVNLVKGSVDFNGQAYNVKFTEKVNGEESLTFSIPAVIFNEESGEFEDNRLWTSILNDHKIRLIKDKNKYDLNGNSLTTIHDFVIKNYFTERDGRAKIINVECQAYSIYELGKKGYSINFSEEDLDELNNYEKANINFWMKKLLIFTKNFHSSIVDIHSLSKSYKVRDFARDNSTNNVYLCLKEHTNKDLSNTDYWKLYQEGSNPTGWNFEIRAKNGGSILYEPTTYLAYTSAPEFQEMYGYDKDSVAYSSSENKSYLSLIDNNFEPLTNAAAWQFISNDRGYSPSEETIIEKQRILKIEKTNVFNVVQELAEKFSIWPKFVYTYSNGVITSRKIIFIEEIERDAKYSITYGVNLNNISKQSDSNDLVTKIIIEPIENELEYGGAMFLSDAPQNLMKEDFLYNFDYYNTCGYLSDDDLRYVKYELPFKIRDCNLNIIANNALKLPYELELNNVQSQISFYNAAIAAKEELKNKYSLAAAGATSISYIDKYSFTVLTKDNGKTQYIDLSSRKGVIDNSSFNFYKFDETPITNYRKIYDPDCPEFIKEITFKDNSITRAKLSFYYNSQAYYTNSSIFLSGSISNYSTFLSNLNSTNSSLAETIEDYNDVINKNLINKQILIDDFEREHSILIKEGNWKDNDYKLRQEFFSPDLGEFEIDIQYTNIPKAFYISNNSVSLETINFSTIRLFKTTNDSSPTNANAGILLEYKVGTDFKLEYGKNSSGEKSLLLIPLDQSAFTLDLIPSSSYSSHFDNCTNLLLQYYDVDENAQSISVPKDTGTNPQLARRSFKLNFSNILESSIQIYVNELDTSPLILDIDYSLETQYDISQQQYYSEIVFKPTREAKFLDEYYKLELYRNITSTFYYNDSIEVANRSSKPVVSYSIGVVDLSPLEGYEEFIPSVGQKILINDKELHFVNEYGFLSEITYELDRPENNELVVSNYKTKFEDLFQRIAATTQQITFKEDVMDRIYETLPQAGIVDPIILQRSFEQNKFILSNSNKNEVVWGSEGITLTDVSGSPTTPGQVKLVGNGIFLSNTIDSAGERVWRTGITGDGINASEITTGSLNTSKITIFDENSPRFIWNANGLFAYSENIDGTTNYNKYLQLSSGGIIATTDATDANAYTFKIDALTGSASFRGSINIPNLDSNLPFSDFFSVSPIGRTTINNVGVVNNGLIILGGKTLEDQWDGSISSNKMNGVDTGNFNIDNDGVNGFTLAVEGKAYFDDVVLFDSSIRVDNNIIVNKNEVSTEGLVQIHWGRIVVDDSDQDIGTRGIYAAGTISGGDIIDRSDRNLKENISLYDYDLAYEQLKDLPIYTYTMKKSESYTQKIGAMIQDMPIELLMRKENSIEYLPFSTIFFNMAVTKKLQEKIESLEKRILELEGLNGT